MPRPAPPYQFIAIARTIARGFTEQAIGHPEGDALTEAGGHGTANVAGRGSLHEVRASGAVSGTRAPRSSRLIHGIPSYHASSGINRTGRRGYLPSLGRTPSHQ